MSYSQGTQDKSITWNEDTLFIFLEAPRKFIPGTKMVFPGLKKEAERAGMNYYIIAGDLGRGET